MRTVLLASFALAACTAAEPVRPMTPLIDPASARAPEPRYVAPPNPLAAEVPDAEPVPGAGAAPHHHSRRRRHK